MTDPYRQISTRSTPQSKPVPGKNMSKNNAGGYGFKTDKWTQFERFLVIGSQGGTYYVGEQKLTADNAQVAIDCINEDGIRAINLITDINVGGKAPKVQQQLFALAIAASASNDDTRKAALNAIHKVCRTGTHLFTFLNYVKQFRGIGRGLRTQLGNWYTNQDVQKVAYQSVKYRQREGWTHRDVLRIAHPKANTEAQSALFNYLCGRELAPNIEELTIVYGFEAISQATNAKDAANLIRQYRLPWETVPTQLLNDEVIWNTLLDTNALPIGALIRQLPRLTNLGLAKSRRKDIVEIITSEDGLRHGRIHPINILNAMLTYRKGRGAGKTTWIADAKIIDALDQAFYLAFGNVEPIGNRVLISVDVSSSMDGHWLHGNPNRNQTALTPRDVSAAMSLITAATESDCEIGMFTTTYKMSTVSPRQRLDDVIEYFQRQSFGGTDCAQPMEWAKANNQDYDTFIIYTDNETWAGRRHPFQALQAYRQHVGHDARLAVCGVAATDCSIADPSDPGMLDVAGFSTDTPNVISGFARHDF